MKVTLGDTTLTLYLTPGHTDGTISTIIPAARRQSAASGRRWGGTLFNFGAEPSAAGGIYPVGRAVPRYRDQGRR